jgi:hypothetical protein
MREKIFKINVVKNVYIERNFLPKKTFFFKTCIIFAQQSKKQTDLVANKFKPTIN